MIAQVTDSTFNVLFVCSRNRLRSPTAERVFADRAGISTASAGLNNDAETPLTADLLDWADVIFVMEKAHRERLVSRFKEHLGGKRIVCLNIPDKFAFMDPALIRLLEARVARFIPGS